MRTVAEASPAALGDYGMRSAREARVYLRKNLVWMWAHGHQSHETLLRMPVSEFRAMHRELIELKSREWSPDT